MREWWKIAVASAASSLVRGAAFGADPILSDPKLTPGDVLPVTKEANLPRWLY